MVTKAKELKSTGRKIIKLIGTNSKWERIRESYVKGRLTPEELARKYNVSISAIKRHRRLGHWLEMRNKMNTELNTKLQAKHLDKMVESMASGEWRDRNKRIEKLKSVVYKFLFKAESEESGVPIKSKESLLSAAVQASQHIELLEGRDTERPGMSEEERRARLSRIGTRLSEYSLTQN